MMLQYKAIVSVEVLRKGRETLAEVEKGFESDSDSLAVDQAIQVARTAMRSPARRVYRIILQGKGGTDIFPASDQVCRLLGEIKDLKRQLRNSKAKPKKA
jgi:hypothetical protein